MTIKDTKQRVTFVTNIETVEHLRHLVEQEKRSGRKMTLSKYLDEIASAHIAARQMFGLYDSDHSAA